MVSNFFKQKKMAAQVRVNRQIFKGRTNHPYISGDGFAQLCDLNFFSPIRKKHFPSVSQIRTATTVFCPSDRLEEMFYYCGENFKAKVVIAGNSDRDFFEPVFNIPESVNRIYLQNSHLDLKQYRTLPIGVENLRFGKNGLTNLFDSKLVNVSKKDAILVGPFSPTHSERMELDSWFDIKDQRFFGVQEYLQSKKIAHISSQFKFIACPRGNGTDTHRFWETLYRGSIPVVKASNWSRLIAQLGVPVMQLQKWDFEEFLFLKEQKEFDLFNPRLLNALWLPYWRDLITS
jgi:hypothetical protein